MALLDFLKNKKARDKSAPGSKTEKVSKALVAEKLEEGAEIKTPPRQSKKSVGTFSYNTVKEPHISEKATYLADKNKYTFKVYHNVNKLEIKKSVEGIYGVDVLDVNMIKIPPKKRRIGRTEGFKKAFTKAVVTIKEGQKIELF